MVEKLVRDRIPEIIENSGKTPITRIADSSEIKQFLLDKILEEAEELNESGSKEEIADILEAIYSLLKSEQLSLEDIEKIRIKKAEQRGSFNKKIILVDVD